MSAPHVDDRSPATLSRRAAVLEILRSPLCDWTDTRRVAASALTMLDADVIAETMITVLAREARRLIKIRARDGTDAATDDELIAVAGTDRMMRTTTDAERGAAADRLLRLAGGLEREAERVREYMPPVRVTEVRNPVIAADDLTAHRDARVRHANRERAQQAQRNAREEIRTSRKTHHKRGKSPRRQAREAKWIKRTWWGK